MKSIDIVHLTFKPPFASGSYNRTVGSIIRNLPEYSQVSISYDKNPLSNSEKKYILVNDKKLSLSQKIYLCFPEKIRRRYVNGISDKENLVFLWKTCKILPELRPKLIICYDSYKMGRLLRQLINWPCRLILSQHGLSYYLATQDASQLYRLQSFDTVIALTLDSYRFDRTRISAYEPSVKILPNFVDTDKFKPISEQTKYELRTAWKLPHAKSIVLLLSRLVPKKGAHIVLQSWLKVIERVPNAHLWIVGGGERQYEDYLKSLVVALGISNSVQFEGFVSPDKTSSCYQAADIYLFPTLFVEGHALSLLEAMSCATACISSDHGGVTQLYSEEEVLFVSDPNIKEAFVEPLIHLLNDHPLRLKMGNCARIAVEKKYSQKLGLANLKDFYQQEINLIRRD